MCARALAPSNPHGEYILGTDASDVAIGGILAQTNPGDKKVGWWNVHGATSLKYYKTL